MFKFLIFCILPLFTCHATSFHDYVEDYERGIFAEVYSLIKVLDLSSATSIVNPPSSSNLNTSGWLAFDSETKTAWVSHPQGGNVIVLDTDEYNIRVIIPYISSPKMISFSNQLAFILDESKNQVRIYDKNNYALLQILNTLGKPYGLYWDRISGSLFVTVQNANSLTQFPF